MTPLGIALLVVGILAIVASFFVPDKGDREDKKDIARKQEQIRKLLDTELDGMKLRVNEATNETVESSMEKSERALEKITNDKIMAVSEYATTIMEEIDRNHKEVMFLYDMLNDKQTDIKNTVRHAEATAKEVTEVATAATEAVVAVNEIVNNIPASIPAVNNKTDDLVEEYVKASENTVDNTPVLEPVAVAPTQSVFSMLAEMDDFGGITEEQEPVLTPVVNPVSHQEEPEKELTEFEILERGTSFSNVSNNNQMILKMNAEGIPVVDIARQLSLGVGEVQLVIDLFK